MPKIPEIVAAYIAAQPESLQPALLKIHAMLAKAYPQAKVEMYATAKGRSSHLQGRRGMARRVLRAQQGADGLHD
jgi:hypothetical protein